MDLTPKNRAPLDLCQPSPADTAYRTQGPLEPTGSPRVWNLRYVW
jgi:hypothetical protein